MTDSQLLAEFVDSQSHEAFEGIVQRYIILVHGAARRMVPDEHLAQDVVQATFIVLLKKAPKVDPRTLPGWLVNTTRLVAREAMRAERTREKREAQIAATRSPIAPAGDEPDISRMMPMLDDALGRLSPEDRTAVVMRFLEGASFAQVAAIIGSTEDTARKRVARALDKLRKIFTKQGLVLNSAGLMGALAAQQTHAVPAAVVTATTSSLFTGGTTTGSHLARAILSARNWTKTITLVAVPVALITGSALFLNRPHHQTPPPPPTAAITAPAVQAAPPQSSPLWLKTFKVGPLKRQPILVRELYRQALLIAARDELGLQTRDESLREWRDAPPPDQTLNVVMQDTAAEVTTGDDETNILDEQDFPPGGDKDDLDIIAREAEALSRDTYVTMLKANHWSGNGHIIKDDAAAPADAETRLAELDDLSQFALIRETHELIRTDGESPQRLGVLIRAYGNLGQMTLFHRSVDSYVYLARSLLYAQRLAMRYPDSPQSYWHRAYAKAMAGLLQPALDDLDAADKLQSPITPPPWIEPLRLYCQEETRQLIAMSASNPQEASFAIFLAYQALDLSADNTPLFLDVYNSVTKLDPAFIRQIYDISRYRKVDGLDSLRKVLDDKLGAMPNLSKPVLDEIEKFHRDQANPNEQEALCQMLIDQGNPSLDKGEPSWTAFGRLIQEITFALIEQHQYQVRTAEYAAQVQPLIADHPFKPLIDVYGVGNPSSQEGQQTIANMLQRMSWDDATGAVANNLIDPNIPSASAGWETLLNGLDTTNNDLAYVMILMKSQFSKAAPLEPWAMRNLRRVNPRSPWVAIDDIQNHWDPQMGPKWEAQYSDDPNVLMALGNKYAELKQWPDAMRCLNKGLFIATTGENYQALAHAFRAQGNFVDYLGVYKQYLSRNDPSDDQGPVNTELAEYYISLHQYQKALTYAEAGLKSSTALTVTCDAMARAKLGDFNNAEKLMIQDTQARRTSPYYWYVWCLHTGHGNLAAAKKAVNDYFSSHPPQSLSAEELAELASLAMRDKRYSDALAMYKYLFARAPTAMNLWFEAMCAADMQNFDLSDHLFQYVASHSSLMYGSLAKTMPILEAAYLGRPDAKLDTDAIDKILATEYQPEMKVSICYCTARCLQSLGQQELATKYFKQCDSIGAFFSADWLLIDQALRDQKIDPFLLSEPATRP